MILGQEVGPRERKSLIFLSLTRPLETLPQIPDVTIRCMALL